MAQYKRHEFQDAYIYRHLINQSLKPPSGVVILVQGYVTMVS